MLRELWGCWWSEERGPLGISDGIDSKYFQCAGGGGEQKRRTGVAVDKVREISRLLFQGQAILSLFCFSAFGSPVSLKCPIIIYPSLPTIFRLSLSACLSYGLSAYLSLNVSVRETKPPDLSSIKGKSVPIHPYETHSSLLGGGFQPELDCVQGLNYKLQGTF